MKKTANRIMIIAALFGLLCIAATNRVQAVTTSFSLESIDPAMWEFGTYTADSVAYAIIQQGPGYAIAIYILYFIVFGAISLLMFVIHRLRRKQLTTTTSPVGVGQTNIFTLLGPVALIIFLGILNLKQLQMGTLIIIALTFGAVLMTILAMLERFNRRQGLSAGKRWALILWQCLPFFTFFIWINLM